MCVRLCITESGKNTALSTFFSTTSGLEFLIFFPTALTFRSKRNGNMSEGKICARHVVKEPNKVKCERRKERGGPFVNRTGIEKYNEVVLEFGMTVAQGEAVGGTITYIEISVYFVVMNVYSRNNEQYDTGICV